MSIRWTSWRTDERPGHQNATGIVLGPDPAMAFRLPHASPRAARSGRGIRGAPHQSAIEALAAAGFWVLRTGVHVVMTDGTRILTIPREDPVNALTMEGIVRDSGMSIEQFRDLL